MTKRRPDVLEDIAELVTDLQRDDRATLAQLALLRNGHPGSSPPMHFVDGEGPPAYADETGEWAITADAATELGQMYHRQKLTLLRTAIALDGIRRRMMAIDVKRANVPDPNDWCHNCLPHGYCNPRTKDGGRYCKWCRTIWQTWGFYPTGEIIAIHEGGDRAKLLPALQKEKKARK